METITEEEYKKFIKLREELTELIVKKVTQMAWIQHGRSPIGTIHDFDFDEEDGKIYIQFELYSCGGKMIMIHIDYL